MQRLPIILVDGLVEASRIFLIAAGLTVIYGVMRILNIAHGALFALGAYAASVMVLTYLDLDLPELGSYAVLILGAILVGVVVGPIIERGVLRWLYGHDEVLQLLATFALFLIIEGLIRVGWQGKTYNPFQPYTFLPGFELAGVTYPGYSVLVVGAAVGAGILMWLFTSRTRFGRLITVVTHDPEIAAAMGVNLPKVYVITFALGSFLAAAGGALSAPMQAVIPSMGIEVIVVSFAVVVIGGLGDLRGAAVGAVLVGVAKAAAVHLVPTLTLFVVYAVMTVVLLIRPYGLFALPAQRKI